MERKSRLLMAATVLLYIGPLLAGLSGMGWYATPVFVALMALWLVIMRPQQWPRNLALWSGDRVVAAAAQIGISALIVVVLFGIGRGIGGVAGFLPNIPSLLPVALSFLSVPLSRMAWNPAQQDMAETALDRALQTLPDGAALAAGDDALLAALLGLAEDVDPVLTADAIDAAIRAPGGALRLARLEAALDRDPTHHLAVREALVLWATDSTRGPEDAAPGIQSAAFNAAGTNPHLLNLFALRGLPLLRAQPDLWASFPDPAAVALAVLPGQPAQVQHNLGQLAEALDAVAPLTGRTPPPL